jgi:hypothetical protein
MNGPDVAGILLALQRLPGTTPEQRAIYRVSRHVLSRSKPRGVLVDPRLVRDGRRARARLQYRDGAGRFATVGA